MNVKTEVQGTPLPVEIAAVWGAFVFEGLMVSTLNAGRASEVLDRWGNGCIELVAEVCSNLPRLWARAEVFWYEAEGFSGIFEYEVVSELGSVIGDHVLKHGFLPTNEEVDRVMEKLLQEFFRDYLQKHGDTKAIEMAV